jgi:hypothetical protein
VCSTRCCSVTAHAAAAQAAGPLPPRRRLRTVLGAIPSRSTCFDGSSTSSPPPPCLGSSRGLALLWACNSRRSPHLRCLSIARNFQAQLASSRPISTWQQSTWGRTELLCRSSARNFFPVTQHYFIHPGSSSSIPRAENGANHAEDFVVGRGVGLLIILQPLSARC